MKVTLHLAISADGFIAKQDGNSDWVSPIDEQLFTDRIKEAGCLVVGRKTFEQYQGSIYPVDGVLNIVLTNKQIQCPNILTATSPQAAVELAKKNDCPGILLAGGGHTNTAFLQENLIDEIFFSVYPLIFGQGIKPFEDQAFDTRLKLLDSGYLEEGITELHYQVLK